MPDSGVVPVDLTPWLHGEPADRDQVAALADQACRTSGFMAISGHGIPDELIEDMLGVTAAFFDLPMPVKLRYRTGDLEGNRGYTPPEAEALSYSLGIDSPPDLFEAFNIGSEDPPAGTSGADSRRFFAVNVWPAEPADFKTTWLRYWAACEELGLVLLDVLAHALGLGPGYFRRFVDHTPAVMRANNYQRRAGAPPGRPGQQRMGAHSDYGSLTILLADPVPGLQIRDEDGVWHDVTPPPGVMLVNLGDLLAEWTNDRWRSTVHRVVPPPGDAVGDCRRRSVAWFQQPNYDALIQVLAPCTDAANPPRYRPVLAGDHLMAKLMGPRTLQDSTAGEEFMRR